MRPFPGRSQPRTGWRARFLPYPEGIASSKKLKEVVEWALQGDGRAGKGSLDEERIFIRDGELFG
jgi:hypothetical protein